ncbi:MAG: CHAT domain-containing protein [Proteobacteria bacterium]|nr:CHAT domain-containing protein [Pseudomonadota bacterium]
MAQDAKYDKANLSEEQLYEAIHRLCHFVPIDSADNLSYAFQEFLVQHAMAALGVNPLLPSEVRDSLKNLFGLKFERREVEIILERLHKAEKVAYAKEKYRLDFRKCTELRKSVKDCEDGEKEVIADWLKSVESKHPELSQDDLQRLEKDLKIFVARIFEQHGAKCAALIYSTQEKAGEVIDDVEEILSDILPEYHDLGEIRRTELPAFFREAKGVRRKYIAELLDSSFLLHAIQIDKDSSALIERILMGRLLYLDTNVLFALLNLDTPHETIAVKRLIEISQQIGYSIVVSTRTAEEFRYSLKTVEKYLKKYPEIPKDLAKVVANYSAGGFIPSYWRKHAETGISLKDFISTYQNIREMLAGYKIEIRDDFCAEVQEDPELEKQVDILYASTGPIILGKSVAEHDAFHRLLIRKLRGGKAHTFSDASAWFLTLDKKLIRYDHFARSREENRLSEVPFCISCDDWFQFIRPLLPRTDDYDKTFIDLLSSPYFRSYRDVPPELAGRIISRLSHFKKYPLELGVKMLTDSLFIQRLEPIDSEEMAAKMLTDSLLMQRLETVDSETIQRELIDLVAAAERIKIERDLYKEQFEEVSKTIKTIEEEKKRIEEQLEKQRSETYVKKYPEINFPSCIKLRQRYSLVVRLLAEKLEKEMLMFGYPGGIAEIEITVTVDAHGFEIENAEQKMRVPLLTNSDPVVFYLAPKIVGPKTIRLKFYQNESYNGEILVDTTVIESEVDDETYAQAKIRGEVGVKKEYTENQREDLRIEVEKEDNYFEYKVTIPQLDDMFLKKFRCPEQLNDLKSFMDRIERELSGISATSYDDEIKCKTAMSKIESIGMDLYKRLFPEELKRILWENKDEIKSIFIVSNEEWIPWEIIKPYESTESGTTKEDFWCIKYIIGRWLSNRSPEESIRIKCGSVIAYDKKGKLKRVNDEKKTIEKIIKNRGVKLISREPRYADILDILSDKEINLFHFACETVYDKNSSDDSYLSLADGALKARDVGVCNLKKGKPIVFVNACESSITGCAVTGIGGFSKAFIDSGSSAFIGTMWKVPDEYALKFSEYFYKNLFEKNLSIGEALQKTRVDLKDSPNPMWLAYSLYGFPLAKIRA